MISRVIEMRAVAMPRKCIRARISIANSLTLIDPALSPLSNWG
jgi:hypothetical protein